MKLTENKLAENTLSHKRCFIVLNNNNNNNNSIKYRYLFNDILITIVKNRINLTRSLKFCTKSKISEIILILIMIDVSVI